MTLLNVILGRAVGLLLAPFAALPPVVGLAAVSLVTAVVMLMVIRLTSPQDRVARVKRQMLAGLFEIRLLSDDLRAILRAQLEIIVCNVRYLGLSLIPMLWMAVPLALLGAQLQSHFAYQGLEVGRSTIVKVTLVSAGPAAAPSVSRPSATLDVPEGLRLDGPPLWIASSRELDWRVTPERAGSYTITVRLGEQVVTKELRVSGPVAPNSPARIAPGFINQFLYPSEPPLPGDVPIERIEVDYPPRQIRFLFWPVHWSVDFLALTMVFAFLLRRRLGVTL